MCPQWHRERQAGESVEEYFLLREEGGPEPG